MTRKRLTIADIAALKGQRQLTMLRVASLDQAAAAEAAGIDIVSVTPDVVTHPRYREVAPSLFSMTGETHLEAGTKEDYLRRAGDLINRGADAVYCSGSLQTVEFLAREWIPVVGHVGLVPSRASWTGGYKAVGKTAASALALYNECQAYENAGAIAVEIEVVAADVAAEISRRMKRLSLWSMGAGGGCDAQYLFATDLLGEHRDHMPRHSKVYRNFAAEYDRLQADRIAAFREFAADVHAGAFPLDPYIVKIDPAEFARFCAQLPPTA